MKECNRYNSFEGNLNNKKAFDYSLEEKHNIFPSLHAEHLNVLHELD